MARNKKLPAGMILRGDTYHADFMVHGRRVRQSLATSLQVAKEMLADLRAKAERRDFGFLDNDEPLEKLREQFMQFIRQTKRPGTVERYTLALDRILPQLPCRTAKEVSERVVLNYREAREGTVSAGTINYEVLVVGIMFNWAAKNKLIDHNPIKGIARLPHEAREGRALTNEEVGRLLTASPEPFKGIFYAYLTTGMRKNELTRLTFDDVDFENREIVVRAGVAKGKAERRIPMDNELFAIIQRQYAQRFGRTGNARHGRGASHDRVFVGRWGSAVHSNAILETFKRYCAKASIDIADNGEGHVDLHSLRRTFATDLITQGVNPKSVQQLLGHKTLEMTMRLYAKIRGTEKRAALARLSYGKGSDSPAHLLKLVHECHEIPTTNKSSAASA